MFFLDVTPHQPDFIDFLVTWILGQVPVVLISPTVWNFKDFPVRCHDSPFKKNRVGPISLSIAGLFSYSPFKFTDGMTRPSWFSGFTGCKAEMCHDSPFFLGTPFTTIGSGPFLYSKFFTKLDLQLNHWPTPCLFGAYIYIKLQNCPRPIWRL